MLPGGLGQESAAAAIESGKTQPRSAEKSANRRAKTYLHRNRNSWGWGGGGGNNYGYNNNGRYGTNSYGTKGGYGAYDDVHSV